MRFAYLKPSDGIQTAGCRGAVNSADGNDYELEVGCDLRASPEMIAHCVMYDEIHHFLALSNSPLSSLILRQYEEVLKNLRYVHKTFSSQVLTELRSQPTSVSSHNGHGALSHGTVNLAEAMAHFAKGESDGQ